MQTFITGVKKSVRKYAGQLGILVLLLLVLSLTSSTFRSFTNIINVTRQVSINMIVACGMTMVLIIGGIDLTVGSTMALSGMLSGWLTINGCPFLVSLLVGLVSGVIIGMINGAVLAKTTLPPFIVTYSTSSIIRGLVYVIFGSATIRLVDEDYLNFGGGSIGFLPLPVIYMIAIIVISILLVNYSKMGRHMYAIGGNMKAAFFSGINTSKVIFLTYTLSGFFAALAGMVLTSRNSSLQPAVGNGAEMDAIAAVVLGGTSMAGGRGSIGGTVLGAFIIGLISNGLNMLAIDSFYQLVVKGIIILIAVYADYLKNKKMSSAK